MDQRLRQDELERIASGELTVSRRAFFNRARLGLLALAGVTVFGIASTTAAVNANEDDEKKDEKKKESDGASDKDREAKEKEKEAKNKESEKAKKSKNSDKNDENKSNTKKKKNKNGDDSNKKKKQKQQKTNPVAAPLHAKYVEDGKDKYGCKDMPNQAEAQAVLRFAPKDPNNLDSNRNGIACDGSEAFMDGVPAGLMAQPFDLTPVARP